MREAARSLFSLDPEVTFLNHGSFGAMPLPVRQAEARWRDTIERQPVHFFKRLLEPGLIEARTALAGFIGARPDNLVLVENATQGANAVLASLALSPGDEVLVLDHGYQAVKNAARYWAGRAGAEVREIALPPLPIVDMGAVTDRIASALGPRARLLIVDHVTSPSALVLPVAEIARLGVPVLVDGAHAPGMLPLDIEALGADWYVGNCHKWLFAGRGTGFLHARPEHQGRLHPTVISHGLGSGWQLEFAWVGTRDASAWLALPEAIAFHRAQPDLMARNRALARRAAELLGEPAGPVEGAMAAIRVSLRAGDYERLWRDWRIEVPLVEIDGAVRARVSAQLYNEIADYERLAAAVRSIGASS